MREVAIRAELTAREPVIRSRERRGGARAVLALHEHEARAARIDLRRADRLSVPSRDEWHEIPSSVSSISPVT
jgi:hypothetical protein